MSLSATFALLATWGAPNVVIDPAALDAARLVTGPCHARMEAKLARWAVGHRKEPPETQRNADATAVYDFISAIHSGCATSVPFWSPLERELQRSQFSAAPTHSNLLRFFLTAAYQADPRTLRCGGGKRTTADSELGDVCAIPDAWHDNGVAQRDMCLSPEVYSVVLTLWRYAGGGENVDLVLSHAVSALSREAWQLMTPDERGASTCRPPA